MVMSEPVLPGSLSRKIYYVSFSSFLSCGYAVYRGHYDLSLVPLLVGITSVLYWKHPDYSWRRYVDMFVVQVTLWYSVYRAWGSENMIPYYLLKSFAIGVFLVGLVMYQKRRLYLSTYCHCSLHIIANISNIVLYSGEIPPFYLQT